jgi:nitrous oxide reductase
MAQDTHNPISRRAFFGVAATGAASAAALTAGSARPGFAQQVGSERTRARYQKTEHVETFYRTNRYYPRGDN